MPSLTLVSDTSLFVYRNNFILTSSLEQYSPIPKNVQKNVPAYSEMKRWLIPGMAIFHGKTSESTHAISRTSKAFTLSFSRILLGYTAISRRSETKMVIKIYNFPALRYKNNGCSKISSPKDRLSSGRTLLKCEIPRSTFGEAPTSIAIIKRNKNGGKLRMSPE